MLFRSNQIADALATMTSMIDGPKEDEARPMVVKQKEEPAYYMAIEGDKGVNGEGEYYSNILQYLKDGTYPMSVDKNDQLTIQNETRLLLDYYGGRLCSSCSEMSPVPSLWRSEAHAANAITYNDFTMTVLYMGNRYYLEDSPNCIKWS